MWSEPMQSRSSSGFFSIDAAFAIFIAVLLFTSFALLAASSSMFAASYAKEISGTNAALRLSSYMLNEAAAERGGAMDDPYVKVGELDMALLQSIDLDAITARSGMEYASVSVKDENKADVAQPLVSGNPQPESFCVQRLALLRNEPVLMEVCVA